MGFGHRVYKNYDPRAKIIREVCHRVLNDLAAQAMRIGVSDMREQTGHRSDQILWSNPANLVGPLPTAHLAAEAAQAAPIQTDQIRKDVESQGREPFGDGGQPWGRLLEFQGQTGPQKVTNLGEPAMQRRLVVGEQHEIVHITQVALCPHAVFHVVVQFTQVQIGEV
jgi:hypothetical protein